jgi:hypothetical protein
VSVFCGGIIIVPMAVVVSCGVWVGVVGLVSFWFIIRVFQFWFSLIWFVVGLCCIMSASVRNSIIFWALSLGISMRAHGGSPQSYQTYHGATNP